MTGWWRRNAVALGALAILTPIAVIAFDGAELAPTRTPHRDVAAGGTTQVGDWTFGPVTMTPLARGGLDVPADGEPVLVSVRVDPGRAEVGCTTLVLRRPDAGRTWADSDIGWEGDSDQTTGCASDTTGAFDVVATMLLPRGGDDAVPDGGYDVELSTLEGGDASLDLRFRVAG